MASVWRIECKGALYHVLSWSYERQDIVLNDDDRWMFLTGLAEAAERFAVDVFAYVLIGNHYHSPDRWDVRAGQISGEQQGRDLQNQASEKQGTAAQIQSIKIKKHDATP
jgi:hypothetical protein